MKTEVEVFCEKYQLFNDDEIQKVQLLHRFQLAQSFGIEEGMTVLEIGCGQGDMTVVLADKVGASGHVTAIDIAGGDYGAPLTLEQSHQKIKQTVLGERISFHLDTDFLSFEGLKHYDGIVFAHSSWYFHSPERLAEYLSKIRTVTSNLFFAEWDLAFTDISQRGHFCAAMLLALHSTITENDSNIQHLFSRETIHRMMEDAGFSIAREETVYSRYLQDGQWEMGYAKTLRDAFLKSPTQLQTLATSLIDAMKQSGTDSLDTFVLIGK
ncbi:SAM-dependent methyltransferase [Chryseomicrobium excrementi]|uniref:SAM-dependent methyltransferase n=1 Tax=Chryseomicrobium excrementi TaxID=2041346 RepID=A0A2M9EZG1_9BACL|nr:class I SAM-dependent methyltransferase [Chryseomicrobium excrementi]PJK16597.1 SAM-dependent methyltransferase [Chryseomicrobium excrementi]